VLQANYFYEGGSLMRLLVTGGAGFIGTNFVKQVLETTPSAISAVTVLDKLTYAGVESNLDNFKTYANFNFIQGDICDAELVNQLIDSVDAVINFAAESHVDRSIANSGDFVSTNVSGVQVLLDAIRVVGKRKRFLQVSTDEVYGSIDEGSWDEFSPLLPNSPYAATKAGGELIARAYHQTHNIAVITLGLTNFPKKLSLSSSQI
jgi:dTDP-glucose 4,6-dehydratase